MKVMPVWHGAVIEVGDQIEIKVLAERRGEIKLAIAAPNDLRIARKAGSPPRHSRPLFRRHR